MEAALAIYNAFRARAQAGLLGLPANEWAEKHPQVVEFCAMIERLIDETPPDR